MNRGPINLMVLSALLAWSSGLLLDVHLDQAGPDHDSHHCAECLLLVAGRSAVLEPGVQLISDVPIAWPAPVEPASVVRPRAVFTAFASRAPPAI